MADVAVAFGIQAAATGWHVPNDSVAAHVASGPDRLVFFASIDPGDAGFAAELERCHQELRCRGVKLVPIYWGVHPLDPRYRQVYAYCQRHGLPILIHMATTFSSGTFAEYFRIRADCVRRLPPRVNFGFASLVEPVAVSLETIQREEGSVNSIGKSGFGSPLAVRVHREGMPLPPQFEVPCQDSPTLRVIPDDRFASADEILRRVAGARVRAAPLAAGTREPRRPSG